MDWASTLRTLLNRLRNGPTGRKQNVITVFGNIQRPLRTLRGAAGQRGQRGYVFGRREGNRIRAQGEGHPGEWVTPPPPHGHPTTQNHSHPAASSHSIGKSSDDVAGLYYFQLVNMTSAPRQDIVHWDAWLPLSLQLSSYRMRGRLRTGPTRRSVESRRTRSVINC